MIQALLVEPLASGVKVALSAALVAVLYVLVAVVHPRRWWLNRAFDVDGYVHDDLAPRLRAEVAVLKAASDAVPQLRRPAARVTVGPGSTLEVRALPDKTAAPVSLRGFLAAALPSLRAVTDPDDLDADDDLGKRVIDLADAPSVLRANRDRPVSRVLAECGALRGTPVADRLLVGGTPLCMALDAAGVAALRAGLPNPHLTGLVPDTRDDDPGAALLLAVLGAATDDDAWQLLRAELDAVSAVARSIAELRHAFVAVFPQVRRMRMDRRPDMDLTRVFQTFNRPYVSEFMSNYNAAVADFKTTSDEMWRVSGNVVKGLKANVQRNLDGRRHASDLPPKAEKFEAAPLLEPIVRSTFFGVHVDENGREVVVEEMSIGSFFKMVGSIFKLLPKILTSVGSMMEGIVEIFMALLGVFRELKKGVFNFVIKLLIVIVNCVLLVWIILCGPALTAAIWAVLALGPLVVKLAFYAVVLGVASVLNLVMAFADTATQGALRHLSLSEDHPEAWLRLPGAHAGNRTGRYFGTLCACSEGYAPSLMPTWCAKISRCVPLSSPAAMLVNRLRGGRLVPVLSGSTVFAHPVLPSDSVACTRQAARYRKQVAADPVVNGFTVPGDVVQDLALAACVGRMAPGADPASTVCELCRDVVTGRHQAAASASGAAFAPAATPLPPLSGRTGAAVAVVLAVGLLAAARLVGTAAASAAVQK